MPLFAIVDWDGPDTVIITAGVSSVLPFMELAKPVISGSPSSTLLTDAVTPVFQGLQRATDVTRRALDGNLMAPLLSAAAMVRLLRILRLYRHLITSS